MAATLTVSPSIIANSANLTVAITNSAPNTNDWYALYKAVNGVSVGTYLDWFYVGSERKIISVAVSAKTWTQRILVKAPGSYILKLHAGVGSGVLAQAAFTVTDQVASEPIMRWTATNGFLPITIREHGFVVFQDKLWIYGGLSSSTPVTGIVNNVSRNVYNSTNGLNWKQVGAQSLPRPLKGIRGLVFNNKMWIFGGIDDTAAARDEVYSSPDGITWTLESHLPAKGGACPVTVFNGQIYVFGFTTPVDPNAWQNVYWRSSDGVTWEELSSPVPKPEYVNQGDVIVHEDRLLVFAETNAVIYGSLNGNTWGIVGSYGAVGMWGFSLVEYNDDLWMINGFTTGHLDEVFVSADDAVTWKSRPLGDDFTTSSPYPSTLQRAVVWNDRIWVHGGWVPFGNGTSGSQFVSSNMIGAGLIRHRHQTTQPDNPLREISRNVWNDSLVVTGTTPDAMDGVPVVRDSSKSDGWAYAKAMWSLLQIQQWVPRSTPNVNALNGIAWSPELAIAVVVAGTGVGNRAQSSTDGVTWTARTTPADNGWSGAAWSPALQLFAAVAITGVLNRVMTSVNGTSWTIRTSPAGDFNWRGIEWAAELGLFVAVADTGAQRVMTSPDGITWTLRNCPTGDWQHVCWSAELSLLVAVGAAGVTRVMTSPDGITWTARTGPGDNALWYGVTWSRELATFVAVGGLGAGTAYKRVMVSIDGINWLLRTTPVDSDLYMVAWSNTLGVFVAAGAGVIMTSPDGVTWTLRSERGAVFVAWTGGVYIPPLKMFVLSGSAATLANITTSNPLQPLT